jgi:hypothetical protein
MAERKSCVPFPLLYFRNLADMKNECDAGPIQDESPSSSQEADLSTLSFSKTRRDMLLAFSAISAGLMLGAKPLAVSPVSAATGKMTAKAIALDNAASVTAKRLDKEVASAFPLFNAASVLPGFDAKVHGARYDVVLHRITTTTTIAETGETVKVTGLLALPAGARGDLPVVSWQHGTILSFDQVPSNLTKMSDPNYKLSDNADSLETLLNVQRFAAQGFVVIAADYVGKGPLRNGHGEGYAVKGVSTKTCIDVLNAGLAALPTMHVKPGKLFLLGWSQGALNTQWLHQALRGNSVAISGTAVASPFNDLSESLRFWTGHQTFARPAGVKSYPELPAWISLCMIILIGSYETQYGIKGLFESAVRPEYRAMAKQYWNDYQLAALTVTPFPTGAQLLVPNFFEKYTHGNNSKFLRLLAAGCASYWDYDSPIRFHFGLADEAIHPEMVARALSAGGKMTHGVPVAGASHRATFLASLYGNASTLGGNDNTLSWFNNLL